MVVKLLVTYFEHNRPREVLELMSKILQFSGTPGLRPRGQSLATKLMTNLVITVPSRFLFKHKSIV